MMTNNENERMRYQRQMLIPGWGEEGQRKLRAATAFIAGAGGLGCPASLFLVLAGIGKISICDDGSVECSNLNRQLLYRECNIGKSKVHAAKEALTAVNPHVEIVPVEKKITLENVSELVGESTVILDCLDNFTARHALNSCAVKKRIPFVHAAIESLAGQMTFIHSPETPCLRCIFPDISASKDLFPVAGAASGIIGTLAALEAIKGVTGIGETLKGKLLIWDGRTMEWDTLTIRRDPACPVCA